MRDAVCNINKCYRQVGTYYTYGMQIQMQMQIKAITNETICFKYASNVHLSSFLIPKGMW